MVRAEWDQGQMPGALDSGRQHALAFRANTGLAARLDLPAVGHVPAEPVDVLVVDVLDAVYAEAADLPPAVVPGPAASSAESSAARPSNGSAAAGSSAGATGSSAGTARSRSGRTPRP